MVHKTVTARYFYNFFFVKRPHFYFSIITGFLFLLLADTAKAQTSDYDVVIGGEVVEQLIIIENTGAADLTGPVVKVKLASGVHLENTSGITLDSGLGNGTIFSRLEGSTTNEFNLRLIDATTGGYGIFPAGSKMKLRFNRRAICDATINSDVEDVATINETLLKGQSKYAIWGAYLNPESIMADISPNITAGEDVQFTGKIKNTGQHSYASNFNVNIIHENFEIPTNIKLEISGTEIDVPPANITTFGDTTTINVTPEILVRLGNDDGVFAYYPAKLRHDSLFVKYRTSTKLEKCNSTVAMKIATVHCNIKVKNTASDLTLFVMPPGFILSSFDIERKNFDFPDALNDGTINGTWGSVNPLRNFVRNGDTLQLSVAGKIKTSSLFSDASQLYANISFSDGKHDEFSWSSQIMVKVKKSNSSSWNVYDVIAELGSETNLVSYKIAVPESWNIEADDEIQLIMLAVMKNDAVTYGTCSVEADIFAVESLNGTVGNRYPTSSCKNIGTQPLSKVVIKNTFIAPLTITGSCVSATSTARFSSSAISPSGISGVNSFEYEFRSNHYVKELQVYVPEEGVISQGTIVIGTTLITYSPSDIPIPSVATFTDGSQTYSNAKCYTFTLEDKYGTYGSSTIFKDKIDHTVTVSFDITFDNPINTVASNSAILYVAKPVNPSVPNAAIPFVSAVQVVDYPVIYPQVAVANPPGRDIEISPLTGEAVWNLVVANNVAGAANLNDISLLIESITGGSFSNIIVTQTGQSPKTAVNSKVNLAPIPAGATHTIEIKGVVNSACNNTERINAVLLYNPCANREERLAVEELVFIAPPSAIQVSALLAQPNLTMCDTFEVEMVISALKGVVRDPVAKLVLPTNTSGAVGFEFIEVRKKGAPSKFPYAGSIDTLTFDLNAVAGVSQLVAGGNDVRLVVKLSPNCSFPINSRLTSYAGGRNFCDEYNSEGSGVPIRTSILTIDNLQSSYAAQVDFSESTLTFDKDNARKAAVLMVKKTSGGNIGINDVISLSMPLSISVKIDGVIPEDLANPLGAVVDTVGVGVDRQRIVTWPAPASISTSAKQYSLEFIMDKPAEYNDVLNGVIDAVIVNKVEGLACNAQLPFCPSIETKAGEGAIAFRIVDLFPALAKDVSYKANSLLNYDFTYVFTVKNFGDIQLNNVSLEDDLAEFYSKGTVSAISLSSSSPGLLCNPTYNGNTDISLLAAGSTLAANDTQTVTLSFNVLFKEEWKNKTIIIENTAVAIASNENGTSYEDKSNNGVNPDLTDDAPTVTDPINTAPPEVIVSPVIDTPPPGFDLTADGVELFEGNGGTTTPLEFEFKLKDGKPLDYDLCFTVYTRDSISMVKDNDYQQMAAKIICIRTGETRAAETVTVTIIGDDKYEKDEPFILQVKPGSDPITCNSPVITILNDDAMPTVIIDEITLEEDKGTHRLGDYSHPEGTNTPQRTEFKYCIKLNTATPQDMVLRVSLGNDNDTATPGSDYYVNGDIAVNIPMGTDEACFTIEVEPDAIPENDEFFTMSFSLEAGGISFYQEVKKTVILNDDNLKAPGNLNEVLAYCPGDDATERSRKLNAHVAAPAGYELRWYSSKTIGTQISEPLMETAQQGETGTFYLGFYNPSENYESPIGERAEVKIMIQNQPQISMSSSPVSPMTIFPGQTVLLTVTPGLVSYDFALNGVPLTMDATSANEIRVYYDKFTYNNGDSYTVNTVDVTVKDAVGCLWNDSFSVDVKQVEFPNAFIPEGSNDANKVFLKDYDIRVFNRWGHLLYKGTDGWDGCYKGSYVAPGTYYYVLNMKQDDGSIVEVKGHVMVVSAGKK